MGAKTSARSTIPSCIAIGWCHVIFIPSRSSMRAVTSGNSLMRFSSSESTSYHGRGTSAMTLRPHAVHTYHEDEEEPTLSLRRALVLAAPFSSLPWRLTSRSTTVPSAEPWAAGIGTVGAAASSGWSSTAPRPMAPGARYVSASSLNARVIGIEKAPSSRARLEQNAERRDRPDRAQAERRAHARATLGRRRGQHLADGHQRGLQRALHPRVGQRGVLAR